MKIAQAMAAAMAWTRYATQASTGQDSPGGPAARQIESVHCWHRVGSRGRGAGRDEGAGASRRSARAGDVRGHRRAASHARGLDPRRGCGSPLRAAGRRRDLERPAFDGCAVLRGAGGNDVWFEADLPTVADTVLHRWSVQSRNARHPLFPLLATGSAYALRAAGLGDRSILALLSALAGAAWVGLFYTIARLMTSRQLDAIVFTLLACSTSSAMFFLVVPETYTLGFADPARAPRAHRLRCRGTHARGWYVAASAVSFSVTSTNWMCGLWAAVARWPWRRALQISINAALRRRRDLGRAADHLSHGALLLRILERGALRAAGRQRRPWTGARALFFHTIVMPHIELIPEPKWGTVMSVQHSPIASSGAWGVAATVAWAALLASTIWSA